MHTNTFLNIILRISYISQNTFFPEKTFYALHNLEQFYEIFKHIFVGIQNFIQNK